MDVDITRWGLQGVCCSDTEVGFDSISSDALIAG
jgi:hypothetical protein